MLYLQVPKNFMTEVLDKKNVSSILIYKLI